MTGYHRKHTIRVLRKGVPNCPRECRGRQRTYTGSVINALHKIWQICGCICGKRLQPFLPEMVKTLERHHELHLDAETKMLLLQISAATIDRRLRPYRTSAGRGHSTTKPGTLRKQSIPGRTFADWDDAQPGFTERDLVAHCGESTHGVYINTLMAVDIVTGWTECLVLPHRSQQAVSTAIHTLKHGCRSPCSVLIERTIWSLSTRQCGGIVSNRKSLSPVLARTKRTTKLMWSSAMARLCVGRLVTDGMNHQRHWLYLRLSSYLHFYTNFFQPTLKLLFKRRQGSKVYKKHDEAQTPHQRAMQSSDVSKLAKLKLQQTYVTLNPAELRRRIDANLKALWRLPG